MEEKKIEILYPGFVNVYLVSIDEGFALIDTGFAKDWEKLENELISRKVLPDRLKIVVLTHGDQDHAGNAKKLQDKYKVKIGIHKDDYDSIKKGEFPKRRVRPLGFKILFAIVMMIRKMKKTSENKNLFNPTFLSDEKSLNEFGFDAKIIHIPGHSKGSIGVLTKDKSFFAGDTFVNRRKPEIAQIIENDDELKESIEKIRSLDVKKIYPGHGRPFLISELK